MHKILLTLATIFALGTPASAQQLFDPQSISYKPLPWTTSGQTTPSTDSVDSSTQANTSPQSEQEEEKKDKIKLIADDIHILNPPAGLSLCTGKYILQNETDYPIQSLIATLNFGSSSISLQFDGVQAGSSQNRDIGLAGQTCNQLLAPAKLVVNRCIIPGMEEDECRAIVQYVPIPNVR